MKKRILMNTTEKWAEREEVQHNDSERKPSKPHSDQDRHTHRKAEVKKSSEKWRERSSEYGEETNHTVEHDGRIFWKSLWIAWAAKIERYHDREKCVRRRAASNLGLRCFLPISLPEGIWPKSEVITPKQNRTSRRQKKKIMAKISLLSLEYEKE